MFECVTYFYCFFFHLNLAWLNFTYCNLNYLNLTWLNLLDSSHSSHLFIISKHSLELSSEQIRKATEQANYTRKVRKNRTQVTKAQMFIAPGSKKVLSSQARKIYRDNSVSFLRFWFTCRWQPHVLLRFCNLNWCKISDHNGQRVLHGIVVQKIIKASFRISPLKVPGKQLSAAMVTVCFCHFGFNVTFKLTFVQILNRV